MIIAARFNGPPGSGNGGYSAGVFAGALGPGPGTATVTLRQPPPLDVRLTVRPTVDGIAVYSRGDQPVADVVAAAAVADVVAPVPAAVARGASYPGFVDHPFPTCYVCGPERPDGLRIFPGLLDDGRTAAEWTVPADVARETVWAALDCPGGWAIVSPGRPFVLGRMTCSVWTVPEPLAECVVVGELLRTEGRKAFVRTALYGSDNAPLAAAEAVWLAIEST